MSNYPKRRMVRVSASCELLDQILRSHVIGADTVIDGVHPDAVLVGTSYDPHFNNVYYYTHESYAEVDDSMGPPMLIPTISLSEPMRWISVDKQLPPSQKNVLAHYINDYGKYRIVRAFYVNAFEMEGDDGTNYEGMDWVESEIRAYVKQGWYEINDSGGVFYSIGNVVTHWMRLPEPPKEGA